MKRFLLLALSLSLSLSAATKAIVFDFAGVMTGDADPAPVTQFLSDTLQITPEEREKSRPLVRKGKDATAFWTHVAEKKGIALPKDWADSFRAVLKKNLCLRPEMYALVDELKGTGLPIGLLTNDEDRIFKILESTGIFACFNPRLVAYEIGAEKPDPAAFKAMISIMKLPAGEIVFIDDRKVNVDAAKSVGIDAIHFLSLEQLRGELKQRNLL